MEIIANAWREVNTTYYEPDLIKGTLLFTMVPQQINDDTRIYLSMRTEQLMTKKVTNRKDFTETMAVLQFNKTRFADLKI